MTCIYFTGRLPPIILNCARGAVEGLAPPAFALAVAGNLAYLGSILIRSLEWKQVRPNLPWIVDSASCLAMDLFIMCQYWYFTFRDSQYKHTGDYDIVTVHDATGADSEKQ
ncbi:unnamed protein product [Closterium sp. NIES-64]|nr:unnamed protein product [Closterium sp. NIES-64]